MQRGREGISRHDLQGGVPKPRSQWASMASNVWSSCHSLQSIMVRCTKAKSQATPFVALRCAPIDAERAGIVNDKISQLLDVKSLSEPQKDYLKFMHHDYCEDRLNTGHASLAIVDPGFLLCLNLTRSFSTQIAFRLAYMCVQGLFLQSAKCHV